MTAHYFLPRNHGFSLWEAEEEIVAACIDHEAALRIALDTLPYDDFRSPGAPSLRRIFYVLAGWLDQGTYDPKTNRERLQTYFPDAWIEERWSGHGVIPEYVQTLCDAVVEANRLEDNMHEAARAFLADNPLASPPPVEPLPPKGGKRGGVR